MIFWCDKTMLRPSGISDQYIEKSNHVHSRRIHQNVGTKLFSIRTSHLQIASATNQSSSIKKPSIFTFLPFFIIPHRRRNLTILLGRNRGVTSSYIFIRQGILLHIASSILFEPLQGNDHFRFLLNLKRSFSDDLFFFLILIRIEDMSNCRDENILSCPTSQWSRLIQPPSYFCKVKRVPNSVEFIGPHFFRLAGRKSAAWISKGFFSRKSSGIKVWAFKRFLRSPKAKAILRKAVVGFFS